jgi:hypothetical protein
LDWLLIAAFLVLLWAPTLDKLLRLDHAPEPKENRVLARRPPISELRFGRLQGFLAASEAYFNDHFGFRNRLIAWDQIWRVGVYQPGDLCDLIEGPHGWRFSGRGHMVENHLGWLKFTPQELQAWQKLLEKRRDWLAARGIQYLFVITPDKESIYPDELPRWIQEAPAEQGTKLDQFLQYMKAHSTVQILDLRPPLVAARKTAPTYMQQDPHWNLFGGFRACQEVIKALTAFPDLPPLRLEDFTWTNVPSMGGALARNVKEDNYYKFYPKPGLPAVTFTLTNIPTVWTRDGSCWISDTAAPLRRTAVIFHDSFGLAWHDFLVYDFKRIIFVWERREFNPSLIAATKPDLVINETLEGFLYSMNPEELMAKDGLPSGAQTPITLSAPVSHVDNR